MKTQILHIFTRTPLHVGAGSSVGAIDQPVIRERHTGFPIIPGSAIKGVLADQYNDAAFKRTADGDIIFGKTGEKKKADGSADISAGTVSFGEARLLAFPLRSAKGSFALATCPLALARYVRDAALDAAKFAVPQVSNANAFAGAAVKLPKDKVALEEYVFTATGDFPSAWAEHLAALLDDAVLREAKTHFVLLSDGDFAHFALNCCQVQHHNKIDDETGTVADGALFNTETVPSETLFYAPLTVLRDKPEAAAFVQKFASETLLQFGGDATTGLGFCTVKLG